MIKKEKEIIFEIKRIGSIQRIAAIDPETGIEAVIQAPFSTYPEEAKKLAAQKLLFILAKKKA